MVKPKNNNNASVDYCYEQDEEIVAAARQVAGLLRSVVEPSSSSRGSPSQSRLSGTNGGLLPENCSPAVPSVLQGKDDIKKNLSQSQKRPPKRSDVVEPRRDQCRVDDQLKRPVDKKEKVNKSEAGFNLKQKDEEKSKEASSMSLLSIPANTTPQSKPPVKRVRKRRMLEPPVKEFYPVTDKDVLHGRGPVIYYHPGNVQLREEKQKLQPDYLSKAKEGKKSISQRLVDVIHEKGGRFLKKDTESGEWYEVSNDQAREKAAQALREDFTPEDRRLKRLHYRMKGPSSDKKTNFDDSFRMEQEKPHNSRFASS